MSKEKALSAENFLDLEERTTGGRPYKFIVVLNLSSVGEGLAPPVALQSLRHFLTKMPPPFTQGRVFSYRLIIWCHLYDCRGGYYPPDFYKIKFIFYFKRSS